LKDQTILSNLETQPIIDAIQQVAHTYNELPSVYYYFTTDQKKVVNHWYGSSMLIINYMGNIVSMDIQDARIINAALKVYDPSVLNTMFAYINWVCKNSSVKLDFKFEPSKYTDSEGLFYNSVSKEFTTNKNYGNYISRLFVILEDIPLSGIIYTKASITRMRNKYVGALTIYLTPQFKISSISNIYKLDFMGNVVVKNSTHSVTNYLTNSFFPGFSHITLDDLLDNFTSSKLYKVCVHGETDVMQMVQYLEDNAKQEKGVFANLYNKYSLIKKIYDEGSYIDKNYFNKAESAEVYLNMGQYMIAPMDSMFKRIKDKLLSAENKAEIRATLADASDFETGVWDVSKLYTLAVKYGYQIVSSELTLYKQDSNTIMQGFTMSKTETRFTMYCELITCLSKSLKQNNELKNLCDKYKTNMTELSKYFASLLYTPILTDSGIDELNLLMQMDFNEDSIKFELKKTELLNSYKVMELTDLKEIVKVFVNTLQRGIHDYNLFEKIADVYSKIIHSRSYINPRYIIKLEANELIDKLRARNFELGQNKYYISKLKDCVKPGKHSNITYYPNPNVISNWCIDELMLDKHGFVRVMKNKQKKNMINIAFSYSNSIGNFVSSLTNCMIVPFVGLATRTNHCSVAFKFCANLIRVLGTSNPNGFSGYKFYYNDEICLEAITSLGFMRINAENDSLELDNVAVIATKFNLMSKVKVDANDADEVDKQILAILDKQQLDHKYLPKLEFIKKKMPVKVYATVSLDQLADLISKSLKKNDLTMFDILKEVEITESDAVRVLNFGQSITASEKYVSNLNSEFVAECNAIGFIDTGLLKGVSVMSTQQYSAMLKAVKIGLTSKSKQTVALAYVMGTALATTTVTVNMNSDFETYFRVMNILIETETDISGVHLPEVDNKKLNYKL
jgi:hypothetical protein